MNTLNRWDPFRIIQDVFWIIFEEVRNKCCDLKK
jgi:hypothetical protein